jgi:Ca2+-binding RTX toxin-like protein
VVTLQGHDFERGALGLVLAGPAAPAGTAIPLTEEADTVTGVDGWAEHGLTLDMAARQTIRAGGGADDLDVDPYHFPGVVVHAGAGNDFVSAGWDRAIEPDGYPQPAASDGVTLFGDGGNDVLAGSNADDTLVGGDESVGPEPDNDLLEGFGGNDVLSGGAGADWLLGGGGDDIFAGGSGADMLWGAQGADRIYGGSEDDRLYGDTLGSYLRWNQVLGGPDPEAFRDLAYFHAGDYYLHEDIPAADSGNDFLAGGLGDDHLYGGAGDDVLEGGDDNDVLHGESGDDVLRGGAGKDWLYGDVRAADREADAAVVARFSVTGVGEVVWHQRRHLDLEEVEGNDYLDGGQDSDILHGGAGNDTLLGGTDVAIDYLHGEAGDDFLDGGPGNDNLEGGGDNDTYRFGANFGNDQLYDSSGVDTIRFAQARGEFGLVRLGRDLLFTHRDGSVQVRDWFGAGAIERVEFAGEAVSGAELNAVVLTQQGGDGGDILDGLDGYADTISGGAGDDRITLGSGDDIADGGPGNDNIVAGPGNDILRAGGGNDRLVGGPGADRYELATGNVTIVDDPADGAVNTVRLGAGVTAAQVAAMRVGDDLRLLIPQGEVTISDYHLAPETFRFEDGAGVVFAPANVRVAVPDATFLAHYRNGTLARARAALDWER